MGYFINSSTSASGQTSSTSDQVQFTSGAANVQSKDDTDIANVAFHVDGDVSVTGKMHLNEIETDQLAFLSDPRYKDKMEAMTDQDGNLILKIEPKTYELKSRPGIVDYGVDAEQVEKVAPHCITKNKSGKRAVFYRKINMHMLKKVQMHEETVRKHEKELFKQKKLIEKQNKLIEKLLACK